MAPWAVLAHSLGTRASFYKTLFMVPQICRISLYPVSLHSSFPLKCQCLSCEVGKLSGSQVTCPSSMETASFTPCSARSTWSASRCLLTGSLLLCECSEDKALSDLPSHPPEASTAPRPQRKTALSLPFRDWESSHPLTVLSLLLAYLKPDIKPQNLFITFFLQCQSYPVTNHSPNRGTHSLYLTSTPGRGAPYRASLLALSPVCPPFWFPQV